MGFLSSLFNPNIESLKQRGKVDKLILALDHKSKPIREAAKQALIEINHPSVVRKLLMHIQNWEKYDHLRANMIGVLIQRREAQVYEPLLQLLKGGDESIKRLAAVSLGILGDRRATRHLIESLKRENSGFVMWGVIEALRKLDDPQSADPLLSILDTIWLDRIDHSIKFGIIDVLIELGDHRVVDPLLKEAQSNFREDREKSNARLKEMGNIVAEAIIAKIRDVEDKKEMRKIILLLHYLEDPVILKPFPPILEEKGFSPEEMLTILLRIGDPRAIEILCKKGIPQTINKNEYLTPFDKFGPEGYQTLQEILNEEGVYHMGKETAMEILITANTANANDILSDWFHHQVRKFGEALDSLPAQELSEHTSYSYSKSQIVQALQQLLHRQREIKEYRTGIQYRPIQGVSFSKLSTSIMIKFSHTSRDSSSGTYDIYVEKNQNDLFVILWKDNYRNLDILNWS
jgi:hypothetical protein